MWLFWSSHYHTPGHLFIIIMITQQTIRKNSEAVYIFTSISWHSFNKAYIDSEKSLAVFIRLLNGPTRPCNNVYDYALHNFMHIFSSFVSHPFYHVYCSIRLHFFYSSAPSSAILISMKILNRFSIDLTTKNYFFSPSSKVPAYLNVVDIAGLVKGAAEGQGLGNAFLSHINACDAIFHLCRKSRFRSLFTLNFLIAFQHVRRRREN